MSRELVRDAKKLLIQQHLYAKYKILCMCFGDAAISFPLKFSTLIYQVTSKIQTFFARSCKIDIFPRSSNIPPEMILAENEWKFD